MEDRYYTIQDPGDPEPYALLRVDRGLFERWIPQENRWSDQPYFAAYFAGGEMGAREVTPEEAEGLKTSLKHPGAENWALMQGRA